MSCTVGDAVASPGDAGEEVVMLGAVVHNE